MQLLFIHIGEPFGVLENQSFPLSSELIIDYNSWNRQLKVEENPNFIANFYGSQIADVSALIGKNGVGKTTFMRFVKELFFTKRSDEVIRKDDVILLISEAKIILYREESQKVSFTNHTRYPVEERRFRDYPKLFDFASDTTLINYSNSIDHYPDSNESASFINISTSFLLQRIGKVNNQVTNSRLRFMGTFRRHQFLELKRQIDFIRENKVGIQDGFKMVDFFDISISSTGKGDLNQLRRKLSTEFRKVRNQNSNEVNELSRRFQNVIDLFSGFINQKSREDLSEEGINDMRTLMNQKVEDRILGICLTSILELFNSQEDYFIKRIDKFHQLFNDVLVRGYDDLGERLDRIALWIKVELDASQFEYDSRVVDKIIYATTSYKELFVLLGPLIERAFIKQGKIRLNTFSREATELLDFYFSAPLDGDIIQFHWPQLSSGEESMVAFYARFQEAVKVKPVKRRNVILLIDEGDLYFHPEWQKKYFNNLINYLKKDHTNTDSVQLIMTTHSPFIVSDLPKHSVIFMNQTLDGTNVISGHEFHLATFGGSIPKIMNEGFFLEDRTISEFAYSKLEKLVLFLKSNNSEIMNQNEAARLIEVVGEPVLKDSLKALFDFKYLES